MYPSSDHIAPTGVHHERAYDSMEDMNQHIINHPGLAAACTCQTATTGTLNHLDTACASTERCVTSLTDTAALAASIDWHGQAAALMRDKVATAIRMNEDVRQRAHALLAIRQEVA